MLIFGLAVSCSVALKSCRGNRRGGHNRRGSVTKPHQGLFDVQGRVERVARLARVKGFLSQLPPSRAPPCLEATAEVWLKSSHPCDTLWLILP